MSTIERALEKQRQLEQQERKKQQTQQSDVDTQAEAEASTPPPQSSPIETATPSIEPAAQTATRTTPTRSAQVEEVAAPQPSAETNDPTAERRYVEINIERLESLGMISPSESFTQIKEEYRYIKRPLLNNAFGPAAATLNYPNLVMVSSSFSGEGKTFTTINLAISMALEKDRKVLLIDADVVKPHVCERLDIPDQPGLMDYLSGDLDVADMILDTNIPNLKLITAGTKHHHSNEMLASERMKLLMQELSERYSDRIVIFDTSPLLGASETGVLSQMTGQAVVVVEEKRATHAQLKQALSLLNPDIAIGLVLNKSNSRTKEYYGYYYASS